MCKQVVYGDDHTAIGQLVNSMGNYGTMLMVRHEALSLYRDRLSPTNNETQ